MSFIVIYSGVVRNASGLEMQSLMSFIVMQSGVLCNSNGLKFGMSFNDIRKSYNLNGDVLQCHAKCYLVSFVSPTNEMVVFIQFTSWAPRFWGIQVMSCCNWRTVDLIGVESSTCVDLVILGFCIMSFNVHVLPPVVS